MYKYLKKFVLDKVNLSVENVVKAVLDGIYYIENGEIKFARNIILVGYHIVETSPCYAVKKTTLNSCYYGDVEPLQEVADAHYWDWKTSRNWKLNEYLKTWALTKEELKKYEK